MADAASGTYGILRVDANLAGTNAAARWSDVSWAVYHMEDNSTNQQYNFDGVPATVDVVGVGRVYSGSFTFDWRPGGNQITLIASGTTRVSHNAAGSPPSGFNVSAAIGDTGSNGAGRGASVAQGVTLPVLRVIPGTPTSVVGTRVSDTSINLTWAQSSASNGAPTNNLIRRKINDGAWADVVSIAAATSAAIAASENQKLVYGVRASNAAGTTAWSADSVAVYTTPAAPSDAAATKVGSDISVAWTPNVAFAEHQHVLEHGVDVAGVVTWDGSPLATITAGTSTYLHVAPNPAQRHVYRVRARNTDVAALSSTTALTNVVQLLTAPAKPTVPAPPAFADRQAIYRFAWVHNPIDSSAQTKFQVRTSLNGGSTWTTGSKTVAASQFLDFAANTWAANNAVTFQVRTKGSYDSGSDGDASYSPWSDSVTVTFKTRPTATITSPANGGTRTTAALAVVLGFSQPESATFVNATIGLYSGATLLEEIVSTTLAGTSFVTRLADGATYSVRAVVRDSNGISSAQVTSTFLVDYTEPVAAVVVATYLPASGIAQLGLTIPAAGGGLVAAVSVSIDRIIDGVLEQVVALYPSAPSLTFLDTTPTIHGANLYRITTRSVDGATTVVEVLLELAEDEWAFMSKGPGFQEIIRFQLASGLVVTPVADTALFKASGRRRPIAQYAPTGSLSVAGSGSLAEGYGSTPEEIEAFLLRSTQGCYRDPTGRRIFGVITGTIARTDASLAQLSYTVAEAD